MHPKLAESQKDPINDCESPNVLLERRIETRHDKSENGLQKQPYYLGVLRAKIVDDECANDCAW